MESYSVNLTNDEWDTLLDCQVRWSEHYTGGYMWWKHGVNEWSGNDLDIDQVEFYKRAMNNFISIQNKVTKKQRADNKWIWKLKKENEELKKELAILRGE
jgi:hypothetical protein